MNPEAKLFLESNGYLHPKVLKDGRYACVMPLIYTGAIITMHPETYWKEYLERYCYHSKEEAVSQLEAWDGTGEPNGWHRHLPSNRRRTDGDPKQEYIS